MCANLRLAWVCQKLVFMLIYTKHGWENVQWIFNLNKRRLGTTLLPWQQKFCDNKMYFTLDHPYAKFQPNLTCIRWKIDHLKFSQNRLSFKSYDVTNSAGRASFCPTNYVDLAIFKPFVTLERQEILRSGKLHSSRYQIVFRVRQ